MSRQPKRPYHDCPHCGGMGDVPLSDELWETLQKVRKYRRSVTCEELLEDGITSNAINNRLNDLEDLGFIYRIGKLGKWIRWKAQ